MHDRKSHFLPLAAAVGVAALLLYWLRPGQTAAAPDVAASVAADAVLPAEAPTPADAATGDALRALISALTGPDAEVMLEDGLTTLLNQPGAVPNESVLTFANDAAYQAFLGRAAAAGLQVIGTMDGLLAARVRFNSPAALARDLLANPTDLNDIGVNIVVTPPSAPAPESRPGGPQVAVGNNLLRQLGVTGDRRTWGQGITIAIIDSGVAPDPTFGSRLSTLDLGTGLGTSPSSTDGHGTAVASLAAGASPDAPGVAPAASLLSIRVTGDSDTSDLFTLAQAIIAATDAGARIINISMGAYSTTTYLSNAINYAVTRGRVVVAAAGNDQAAQLIWPAADTRVLSVGSVDGAGQQDIFSNSGPQLKLTAPGYMVQAAWLGGQRVLFTGTSASSPVVAGAVAAMLTQNPGMSATEAARVLQQYASDGGPAGPDPDYGNGTLNLGWAMNRNDPARVDTAISSHYFNSDTGNMEFLVQNRSGAAVGGLTFTLDNGGGPADTAVPLLQPGEVFTVTTAVDPMQLAAVGKLTFRTTLTNPPDVATDAVPANNRASSSLTAPTGP